MSKQALVLVGAAAFVGFVIFRGGKEGASVMIRAEGRASVPAISASAPVEVIRGNYGSFPEVDQYLEQFLAAVDQAINSWVELKGNLVIDRKIVFDQLIDAARAIATIESGGDPNAISQTGRLGLMQLTPKVGIFLNEGEDPSVLFDPHYNIFRGTWYYTVLWMQSYGELGYPGDLDAVDRLAAARYFRGGANVAADSATWSEEVWRYIDKFETAKADSR